MPTSPPAVCWSTAGARSPQTLRDRVGVDPAPLVAALDDPTSFIEVLDWLPQTLCHNDAHVNNLVVRRSAEGGWDVWAIDWQMVGTGPLGSDLAQLLVEVAEPDLPRVEAIVLEAYLEALYDDGVRVGREAVEFAMPRTWR
jgi:thiamine kinase-like enzyme